MEKHELVGITLSRLIENFKVSPESFEFLDNGSSSNDILIWQPKITLTDKDSTIVQDPNNNHAIIIQFNKLNNELSCHIFLKPFINITSIYAQKADSVIFSRRWLEKLRGNYKKFKKLQKLIAKRDRDKESRAYLNKLSSVFPDALDDLIF